MPPYQKKLLSQFKMYPIEKVHPMAALRTAVSLLGLYDEEADQWMKKQIIAKQSDSRQKCLRL